ncbi:MAG: 3-ketoacyl-ACP reductase [Propionibacteriaceae bacterium]|jgi:NAD(P)-dependent dehydrogenase (short-subunit alcohol dehydrogenase family)|nr:3-ketoacyl-ACP reductase [Propionibacteriaceae bacterium]
MGVAMVTGGSRGIGLGITTRLVHDGWQVAVMATKEDPGEKWRSVAPDGLYVSGSVAERDSHKVFLDATLERFGRVDLLVNNAGVAPRVRDDILVAGVEEYDRVMGINLRGPYFLTQLVANQMIAQRGDVIPTDRPAGTIINVSSISATVVSTNRGEYCLSKAGVAMATQLWAARLGPEGIVVYEIRPGIIATDMTAGVQAKYDAAFASGIAPMPRWGQPSDVAGVVAVLASGNMPYSTGDVIHVGGGMQIAQL